MLPVGPGPEVDEAVADVAPVAEVHRQVHEVEQVPEESPVGDHEANGEAESAVREVKR